MVNAVKEYADYKKFPKLSKGDGYTIIWTIHAKKRSKERTSSPYIANTFLWDMLKSATKIINTVADGYIWLRDKDTNYTFCIHVNKEMKKIRIITVGLTFCRDANKVIYPYQNEFVIERINGEVSCYIWDKNKT